MRRGRHDSDRADFCNRRFYLSLLERGEEIVGYIGFILLLIGAGGVDSNLAVAAGMILTGLSLLFLESKKEETAHRRPKH